MCDPVTATIAVVGSAAGAVAARSQQKKALRAQEQAQQANLRAQAKLQADAAKAEANARRTPNYGALFARNAERRGVSATMLTGASGVSGSSLALGGNTLLGG